MKRKITAGTCLKYLALLVILLLLLFPIYWMIITSLKTNMEAYQYPPTLFADNPTIETYLELFTKYREFFVYYKNNFLASAGTTFFAVLVAILSGYALSRFHFKWNRWIAFAFLASQMFPIVSRMISLYGLMGKIHLINTHTGLIFALVAAQIPFCVVLMTGFYDSVPGELAEAAVVDGAGRFYTLFRIVVPLAKPGILAVGIYAFLMTWDDYLHAATLIQTDTLRTLSVGISLRYLGELSYDWSLVNTISVVGALPMIFLSIFFQKYMVKGLVAGAVKG